MLFLKQKSVLSSKYQNGMMKSVPTGLDGIIWKVNAKQPDTSENVERETFHSVQNLVMIHAVDELNLVQEFGETVCAADLHLLLNQKCGSEIWANQRERTFLKTWGSVKLFTNFNNKKTFIKKTSSCKNHGSDRYFKIKSPEFSRLSRGFKAKFPKISKK